MTKIPDEILEKHLGILGINGSGKTYAAKGLAERLLDQKQRICVLDPTGVWYGLKSSATGKSAGYPVVIFGGPHADLQISGSHGDAIAETIGTSSTPAIIDVSQMRGSDRTQFFADFAETLRIKNVGPLNLFIDEAHLFMPQGRVSDPNSAQMLHAANNLISLGRSRGLRVTIISQRPAKIHKDSLTQVHSLIALRLIAPQDRAAVEAWIADQADITRGKAIIASLPSLKTGEGWIWAPELEILERVKFPKISTFDTSKSPDGAEGSKIVLAPINLDTIQGKLACLKQDKIANDPMALRKRVAELEGQLRAAPTAGRGPDIKAVIVATAEAYRKGHADGIEAYGMAFEAARATLAQKVFDTITNTSLNAPKKRPAVIKPQSKVAPEQSPTQQTIAAATNGNFSGPERRILKSLQFWKSIGHEEPTRHQVALVAGYSPNTSSFKNALSSLRTTGAADSLRPGTVSMTAVLDEDVMDSAAARATILSVLDGPNNRIIEAFDGKATAISRDNVAEGSGYSPNTSSFKNAVSRLSTLGIIHRPSAGMLELSDWARELLT